MKNKFMNTENTTNRKSAATCLLGRWTWPISLERAANRRVIDDTLMTS